MNEAEGKNKKEYGKNRYHNMSQEKKQQKKKKKEYQKNIVKQQKSKYNNK